MKKKILAMALSLCLVAGFAGCGGNSTMNSASATKESTSTTVTKEEPQQTAQAVEPEPAETPSEEAVSEPEQPEAASEPEPEPEKPKISPETLIEGTIRARINSQYTFTSVDSISINEDLGTEAEGDYIALVNLTWSQKNSGSLSKKVLDMYSSDLAATVAEECPEVQEIAIFWTVPYLKSEAKCSYERRDGHMYKTDESWPSAFN